MPLTKLQSHINSWKNCQRCPLYKGRKQVVICRGQVPAEVLFIGEAPGDSEDVFGLPFYGPAGKELDKILERVEKQVGEKVTKCWTNLVACIPKTASPDRKKTEPLPAEIASCYPRLDYFIKLCEPKLIVAVGELAQKHGLKEQHWEQRAKVISITHPAAILRAKAFQKPAMIDRVEVALLDGFRDMLCPF